MVMNKIIFIGKFNVIMQNVYLAMSRVFDVQLCPAEYEIVEGLFQMVSPDLVLISTMDFGKDQAAIYRLLAEKYGWLPVLSVGKKEELRLFYAITQKEQFHEIYRPVKIGAIVEEAAHILGIPFNDAADKEDVANVRSGPKTILLVDDSAVLLRQVREILKDQYRVLMAPSGLAAMDILAKEKPDLIFLDYDMPIVDGKMALKKIRTNHRSKDIPVVFLTAINDKEKILAVMHLNPSDYLLKPVNANRLLETAERIIGK